MAMSSDEFDSIRMQIYELGEEIEKHLNEQPSFRLLHYHLLEAKDEADDLRIDLLDSEEEDNAEAESEFHAGLQS